MKFASDSPQFSYVELTLVTTQNSTYKLSLLKMLNSKIFLR
ncbi:hypothetical protein [Leptospira noguchii]|nr:hypothetical protein [Leptospira noguchii]